MSINPKWEKKYGNKSLKRVARENDCTFYYERFVEAERSRHMAIIRVTIALFAEFGLLIATLFFPGLLLMSLMLLGVVAFECLSIRIEHLYSLTSLMKISEMAAYNILKKELEKDEDE